MKNKIEYIKVKDNFLSKEKFTLFLNEANKTLITFPKPSKEKLPRYYESPEYLSHKSSGKSMFSKVFFISRRIMLYSKLKMISALIPNPGSVVDVGSGTGYFLSGLKKKGWSTQGIEPNLLARKMAIKNNIVHSKSLKELKKKELDLITFWHSLEHVFSLEEALFQTKQALKNKGFLIVACPNYMSWDAKYYKKDWAAWDVPRHLRHFSSKSLALILEPMGFKQVKKKPLILDAFYISIVSEKQKGSRFSFLKGFVVGAFSNFLGFFSNNYSSQVYVFQKTDK